MRVLITGCAGFIGFHLTKKLIQENFTVFGIDNLNNYYDPNLKIQRLKVLGINYNENNPDSQYFNQNATFSFRKIDITHRDYFFEYFSDKEIDIICNLAAQVGVRNSLKKPFDYIDTNLVGFGNVIEIARQKKVKLFLYASSSSVYGNSTSHIFKEIDNVDKPISLYAATKRANELIAYSYCELYELNTIGLRFFTVYGPYGRPDMASFDFVKRILSNEKVSLYNNGNLERDFTYVDDIIESIFKIISSNKTYVSVHNDVYNIGNGESVSLGRFVKAIENALQKKAIIEYLPMQQGDVFKTNASTEKLNKEYDFKPKTSIEKGMKFFVEWFIKYYK